MLKLFKDTTEHHKDVEIIKDAENVEEEDIDENDLKELEKMEELDKEEMNS